MSTKEPDDENGNSPLTPIYAFNLPGEAIDLYSGPIGGLCDLALQGTIRLVPFPSADLRWQVDVPNPTDQSTVATVGDWVDLTAGGIAGRGMVSSTSFGSLAGISPSLESESGDPLDRALVHWMNLPDYTGNRILHQSSDLGSATWNGRLSLDGWSITLDGRPDNGSLFKEDAGLALYVLTHVMELRRADGSSFDVESAKQVIDALRLSLSFATGRWVAPTLSVGFDPAGVGTWRWWVTPICAPYKRIGSPVISPGVFGDLEAFLKASVAKLASPP